MQLSVYNCSPPSGSVLTFVISGFTKKSVIVPSINPLKSCELPSASGIEEISALQWHKGTLIGHCSCTQLWRPGHLPKSLPLKIRIKRNSPGCCLVLLGCSVAQWRGPVSVQQSARSAHRGVPSASCSHSSRSPSAPNHCCSPASGLSFSCFSLLDGVQELVTLPQLCWGSCMSSPVPALSQSFFSVYICSDLRSTWRGGAGVGVLACRVRDRWIRSVWRKWVIHPHAIKAGIWFHCFFFFSSFFSLFSSSPGPAIAMKHFCTGLISTSPYLLFSVCPCGWVPWMFILLQRSAMISGQDVQR